MNDLDLEVESKNVAKYGDSFATHNFDLKAISCLYRDKLKELLDYENAWNGDFRISYFGERIYSISYETTDCYEFGEDVAEEIGDAITVAIAKLAKQNGGYEAIAFE